MFHDGDNNDQSTICNPTESQQSTTWTRLEDKLFEESLVLYPEETADRWEKIAERIPGKLAEDVIAHYDDLVNDVQDIDSGRIELPNYSDEGCGWETESSPSQISFGSLGKVKAEVERKKGTPWTEDEHKLFLVGLEKYGKGDWRSISRNVVVTRTPTQVASHAQKYFNRQNSNRTERRRSSIHDITTAADGNRGPAPSNPHNQGGSLGYQNFNLM